MMRGDQMNASWFWEFLPWGAGKGSTQRESIPNQINIAQTFFFKKSRERWGKIISPSFVTSRHSVPFAHTSNQFWWFFPSLWIGPLKNTGRLYRKETRKWNTCAKRIFKKGLLLATESSPLIITFREPEESLLMQDINHFMLHFISLPLHLKYTIYI